MASLNKVMLIGNLTADPEVRTTPRGNSLTELRLAVNRVISAPGEGERREETTFLDITCWGRQAEIAAQYLTKGRSVYIEGRLQMDQWEDKQTGQKRSRIRIIADNLQMLGSRGDGAPQGQGGGYQRNNYNNNNYGNNGGYQQQGGYQQGGYQQQGGYPRQAPAPQPQPQPQQQQPRPMEEDDDIPF